MTAEAADTGFTALLDRIERERGFACSAYKHTCLRRRIRTRMRLRGIETFEAYGTLIDGDAREMDKLVDTLTINVTRFFRNRPVWDAVAEKVVPALWDSELSDVRAWSAGCASGEEAFSIAMLFHRHAAVNGMLAQIDRVRVTGTDVDAGALRAAAAMGYSEADIAEVPGALRERYFPAAPPFHPARGIQRMVRFVRHDLLTDAFPVDQHLIICRNVLIYFDRRVQEQVIGRLRESLAPGGFLILGRVESLLGVAPGFERISPKERIFRRHR